MVLSVIYLFEACNLYIVFSMLHIAHLLATPNENVSEDRWCADTNADRSLHFPRRVA